MYQNYLTDSLKDKYGGKCAKLEKLIVESNAELQRLQAIADRKLYHE
jgi:hypothetical protein